MRRCWLILLFSSLVAAQTPQTPRQALLELLKATSPEQIDRHTPEVLLQELAKLPPDMRQKQRQSMMMLSMFMMAPDTVQTFETGPVFAVIQDPKDKTRIEVTIERDDLAGDTDTMEMGIRFTKDGQLQELPFSPRVLIDMKSEKGVWKLSRVGGSASVQLDDPKTAALIVKTIKEQAAKITASVPSGQLTVNGDASTSNVVRSLRTLNTAEATYLTAYPRAGYACKLSDLGGSMTGRAADEHGAQLINPALETGTRYGYKIEFARCDSHTYEILAKPIEKSSGRRAYCTDQSGIIKSVDESQGNECSRRGVALR